MRSSSSNWAVWATQSHYVFKLEFHCKFRCKTVRKNSLIVPCTSIHLILPRYLLGCISSQVAKWLFLPPNDCFFLSTRFPFHIKNSSTSKFQEFYGFWLKYMKNGHFKIMIKCLQICWENRNLEMLSVRKIGSLVSIILEHLKNNLLMYVVNMHILVDTADFIAVYFLRVLIPYLHSQRQVPILFVSLAVRMRIWIRLLAVWKVVRIIMWPFSLQSESESGSGNVNNL